MHGCQIDNKLCVVHAAEIHGVRLAFIRLILAEYGHHGFSLLEARTRQLMPYDPCVTCKSLDDCDEDVIIQAALIGRHFAEEAKAYLRLLFGDQSDIL